MIKTTLRRQRRDPRAHGARARKGLSMRIRTSIGAGSLALFVGAMTGCGTDGAGIPPLSTDPFMTAQLNVRSATMSTVAPYNTLQLTVTPYTATGHVVTDSIVTTYLTKDTTLSVTASGLVTALFATTDPTWVVATVRDLAHNVTHVDTMFVTITETTPASPLASLTIQPLDSTRLATYDAGVQLYLDTLHIRVAAANGSDLSPSVFVRFLSSDSSIARVDPVLGIVRGVQPGHVTIRAMTTYYGVTKTDSLAMDIELPVSATVFVPIAPSPTVAGESIRTFNPSSITIGVGGTIIFVAGFVLNPPYLKWDVVFDDPTAADPSPIPPDYFFGATGAGNIGPIEPLNIGNDFNPACLPDYLSCNAQARSFPVAGTYHYHSALYGSQGTIIVKGP